MTENGPNMFKKASDFLEDELDKLMSYLPASQTPTADFSTSELFPDLFLKP